MPMVKDWQEPAAGTGDCRRHREYGRRFRASRDEDEMIVRWPRS